MEKNQFRQIISKGVDAAKLDPPAAQDSPSAMPPDAPAGDAREKDYRTNPTNPPDPPAPFKG